MAYEFETPQPPALVVEVPAGRVEVTTGDSPRTVVEVDPAEEFKVEQHGDEVRVRARRRFFSFGDFDVRIEAPHGASLRLDVASAAVRAHGRLGDVDVNTASGDVALPAVAGRLRVNAASGDVEVADARGPVDANTA